MISYALQLIREFKTGVHVVNVKAQFPLPLVKESAGEALPKIRKHLCNQVQKSLLEFFSVSSVNLLVRVGGDCEQYSSRHYYAALITVKMNLANGGHSPGRPSIHADTYWLFKKFGLRTPLLSRPTETILNVVICKVRRPSSILIRFVSDT